METETHCFFPEEQESVPRIRAALSADPEWVCGKAKSLCKDAQAAERLRQETGSALADCLSAWRGIEQTVCVFCDKLPTGTGFFSTRPGGKEYYPTYCAFLESLMAWMRRLREALFRLSDAVRIPECVLSHRLRAEWFCRTLATCGSKAQNRAEDLLTELEQDRKTADTLITAVLTWREQTEQFCRKTFPAFCDATLIATDAEHTGEGFRPSTVSQLCGELRFAVQKLISEGEALVKHHAL